MFMPHYRSPQTGEWPCPMWLETTRKVTKSPPLKAHSWGSGHKDYNLPVPTKNEFLSLFYSIVTVRMDPPKLVPPGTNFLINKDPPELMLLQNMDSLLKNLTISQRWKNVDPEYISLAKFGPVAYLGDFRDLWKLLRPISSAACNVLYSHSRLQATLSFRVHCAKFVTNTRFKRCSLGHWGILVKSSHSFL